MKYLMPMDNGWTEWGRFGRYCKRDWRMRNRGKKFWRLVFEHQVMELVVQGNLDAAEERVRSGISRLRSES